MVPRGYHGTCPTTVVGGPLGIVATLTGSAFGFVDPRTRVTSAGVPDPGPLVAQLVTEPTRAVQQRTERRGDPTALGRPGTRDPGHLAEPPLDRAPRSLAHRRIGALHAPAEMLSVVVEKASNAPDTGVQRKDPAVRSVR